ncbi:hypothetical protein MMC17_000854 [Xylographa soralifera]|nr:hypothetical protein [Xylographa soralifera]
MKLPTLPAFLALLLAPALAIKAHIPPGQPVPAGPKRPHQPVPEPALYKAYPAPQSLFLNGLESEDVGG